MTNYDKENVYACPSIVYNMYSCFTNITSLFFTLIPDHQQSLSS